MVNLVKNCELTENKTPNKHPKKKLVVVKNGMKMKNQNPDPVNPCPVTC